MSAGPSSFDERVASLQDEHAMQLVSQFCALEQVSRLYDIKNAAVGKVVRDMVGTVQQFSKEVGEALCLTVAGHSYFVNRHLTRFSIQAYRRAQHMSSIWAGLGIGEITFPRDLNLAAAEEFIAHFVAALKDPAVAPALLDHAFGGVMVRGPVQETGIDDRVDPRDAATKTYAALVVLVREMLDTIKAGQAPNTLPIRRCLQALVEQSARQPDLLFALSRRLAPQPELAVHLANVALYSLLIARRLELGRASLVSLASAALFHDLPKVSLGSSAALRPEKLEAEERDRYSSHWLKTVRYLLEAGGLTDEVLSRLVVMYEAQLEFSRFDLYLTEPGRPGDHCLFSMIIAVADRFDTDARSLLGGKLSAPDQSIGALLEGAGKGLHPGLVRLFVETVGLYPLGTMLLLNTGELGLVTAVSDPQQAARPTLSLIADLRRPSEGELAGGSVELAFDKQRQVLASADAGRLGVNPVAVFRPA